MPDQNHHYVNNMDIPTCGSWWDGRLGSKRIRVALAENCSESNKHIACELSALHVISV